MLLAVAFLVHSQALAAPLPLPVYDPSKVAGAAPSVSAGSEFLGGTSGAFSVAHNGVATYEVPLEVVPGRGGFQPKLAIQYSSSGGNGPLGVGFGLSGLSEISRCEKTVADDGIAEGVRLNESDRFCLNGMKLVLVSGTYGGEGAEYRTMPDTHVRVRSHLGGTPGAGPRSFVVEQADGTRQVYGANGDAVKIKRTAHFGAPGGEVNIAWPISRATDPSGNLITYSYGKTVVEGNERERWLEEIRYSHGDRRVIFEYNTRPDKAYGYRYGREVERTRRLTMVTMSTIAGTEWKRARLYILSYQNDGATGASKLQELKECGELSSECKRPTTFKWQLGQAGFKLGNGVTQSAAAPASSKTMLVLADYNGDDRTDIAYPTPGPQTDPLEGRWNYVLSQPHNNDGNRYASLSGGVAPLNPWGAGVTAYPFDYDLDGRADLLPRTPQTITWSPILSRNGTGVQAATNFLGPLNQDHSAATAVLGDFDGDGYQDVLQHKLVGDVHTWYWRQRSGVVSDNIDHPSQPTDSLAFGAQKEVTTLRGTPPGDIITLDTNGDGRMEVLLWKRWSGNPYGAIEKVDVALDTSHKTTSFDTSMFLHPFQLLDVNGDGLTDMIVAINDVLHLRLNTGNDFDVPVNMGLSPTKALSAAEVIDIDGDGRDELLIPRQSPLTAADLYLGMDLIQASFSGGSNPTFKRSQTSINFPQHLTLEKLRIYGPRVVDADGDGLDDVLVVDRPEIGSPVLRLFEHNPGKPDLLIEIREGSQVSAGAVLPATVRMSYAPLSDASVYERGDCPRAAHMMCLSGAVYVVKEVQQDTGLATSIWSSYRYKTGKIDKKSRTMLGFSERMVRAVFFDNGVKEITDRFFYSNSVTKHDPRLLEHWNYTSLRDGRQSLEQTKFAWKTKYTLPATNHFDHVERVVRNSFEFPPEYTCGASACLDSWTPGQFLAQNKTPFRSVTEATVMDWYGNVTSHLVEYDSGKDFTHTTTDYAVDTEAWLLRRVKSSSTKDHVLSEGQFPLWQSRTVEYEYPLGSQKHAHLPKSEKRTYGGYASGANNGPLKTDYEYDGSGNVVRKTTTDLNRNIVREATFAYDPLGYPHAQSNALGHTSYTGYNPLLGKPQVVVDANGARTDHVYDTLGRLVKTKLPGGVEKSMAYALEKVGGEMLIRLSETDNRGAHAQQVFDRVGRPVIQRHKGADGKLRHRHMEYDMLGRVRLRTAFAREGAVSTDKTTYEYDNRGRLFKQVEPGNAVDSWQYEGLQVTMTNSRGYKKQWSTDERGRKVRVVDGLGSADQTDRRYEYNPFGHLSKTYLSGGSSATTSRFAHDPAGNLFYSLDPERGETRNFQYNAFGDVLSFEDANLRVTSLSYDALGRVTNRKVSKGGSLRSAIDYAYDSVSGRTSLGRTLRVTLTDMLAGGKKHTTDYFYDAVGRPTVMDHSLPSELSAAAIETLRVVREYDTVGRLQAVVYPRLPGQTAATKVRYEYGSPTNSNGRLLRLHAVEPDALPQLLWEANPNTDDQDRLTLVTTGDGVRTHQARDWRGALTWQQVGTSPQDQGGYQVLSQMQYQYDGEGNLLSRKDLMQPAANGAWQPVVESFTYDALDRVKLAAIGLGLGETWTYDQLGNIKSSSRRGVYAYDPQRPTLLLSVTGGLFGSRNYSYDAVGNQVKRPEGTVEYNDFNLPARLVSNANVPTATFLYTGEGQRARKDSQDGTTTYFPGLYERHRTATKVEHRLLVNADARTNVTLRYLEAGGKVQQLPALYSRADHLGSTSMVTQNDSSTGLKAVVKERRSYDAFGLVRNPNWLSTDVYGGVQAPQIDQGYTGHDDDRELGLINMKGRMYDPKLGRFLTPDPFVDGANASQAWNRYAYVSNNPLRNTDPTGFIYCNGCEEDVAVAMGMAFVDFFNNMIADSDAFSEGGAVALFDREKGTLEREAEKHDRRVQDRINYLNKQAEKKAEYEQKVKALQEKLAKQKALEELAKIGRSGRQSQGTGSNTLPQATGPNAVACFPCAVAVAGVAAEAALDALIATGAITAAAVVVADYTTPTFNSGKGTESATKPSKEKKPVWWDPRTWGPSSAPETSDPPPPANPYREPAERLPEPEPKPEPTGPSPLPSRPPREWPPTTPWPPERIPPGMEVPPKPLGGWHWD
jgi:RHS repeat-associated protein